MNQEKFPALITSLQTRNDNIIPSPTTKASSGAFGHVETFTNDVSPRAGRVYYPELPSRISPPKAGRVFYPKLPSRISPTRQTNSSALRSPDAPLMPLLAERSVHSQANIGRKRANAISFINTPPRNSRSEQLLRVFHQAQDSITFQREALNRSCHRASPCLSTFEIKSKKGANSTPKKKISSRAAEDLARQVSLASSFGHKTDKIVLNHQPVLPLISYRSIASSRLPPLSRHIVTTPLGAKPLGHLADISQQQLDHQADMSLREPRAELLPPGHLNEPKVSPDERIREWLKGLPPFPRPPIEPHKLREKLAGSRWDKFTSRQAEYLRKRLEIYETRQRRPQEGIFGIQLENDTTHLPHGPAELQLQPPPTPIIWPHYAPPDIECFPPDRSSMRARASSTDTFLTSVSPLSLPNRIKELGLDQPRGWPDLDNHQDDELQLDRLTGI